MAPLRYMTSQHVCCKAAVPPSAESGAISREQLASAFSQVGMAPTEDEITSVAAQLGKTDDYAATFTFSDFAQAADMLSPVES